MKNKKGYSILELTLVLGAISILVGGIFMYYQKQRQEVEIKETIQQVNTIFDASDDFLATDKPDGSNQSTNPISMQVLKDSRALSPDLGSYSN